VTVDNSYCFSPADAAPVSSVARFVRVTSLPDLEAFVDQPALPPPSSDGNHHHWSFSGESAHLRVSSGAVGGAVVFGLVEEHIEAARRAYSKAVGSPLHQQDKQETVSPLPQQPLNERDRRRIERSRQQKRRMSLGVAPAAQVFALRRSTLQRAAICSPATPAQLRRGRSKQTTQPHAAAAVDMEIAAAAAAAHDDEPTLAPHEYILGSDISERNFKGVVIGGVYQNLFDGRLPVVAPASAADKRVTGVSLRPVDDDEAGADADDVALVLRLFIPKDRQCKTIDLGSGWVWTRTAQDGYLVCREPLRPNRKLVWCVAISKSNCLYYSSPRSPLSQLLLAESSSRVGARGAG